MAQYEVDNRTYPLTTVCYISAKFPNGTYASGSGVVVGRNDVLTASHVIYDRARGGGAVSVEVTPAYDPSPFETPYGKFYSSSISYFTNFDPNGDGLISGGNNGPGLEGSELDIGFISFDVAIGDSTGWMGIDYGFTSGYVNLTGYPGYYSNNPMNDYAFASASVYDNVIDIRNLEVHPGNSGGPVWYDAGGGPYLVGIVSTGSNGRGASAADVAAHADQIRKWTSENDYLISQALNGTAGPDQLVGGPKEDRVNGLAGNDRIRGAGGDDIIDGGPGADWALFSGRRLEYSISFQQDLPSRVVDQVGNRDGADTLSNIERLQFSDQLVAFDNAAAQGYRLYQAAFARAGQGGVVLLDR